MEKRIALFFALSFVILMANMAVMRWLAPPKPVAQQQDAEKKDADKQDAEKKVGEAKQGELKDAKQAEAKGGEKPAAEAPAEKPAAPRQPPQAERKLPPQWVTLGSGDPNSPYRMLVTFTSAGAAVERIEMNGRRLSDLEDRSGYLGHLAPTDAPNLGGCEIRVVGPGTPADVAGLKPGDVITSLGGEQITSADDLRSALGNSRVGDEVDIALRRAGQQLTLQARLTRRPLEVVRPEGIDPLSFLLTLERIDDETIAKDAEELPGLKMRSANWQLLPGNKPDEISFQYDMPERGLEVIKTFRLATVADGHADDEAYPAFHLEMAVEIRNTTDRQRTVAYRLDGPTGLPKEGAWYATKISPNGFIFPSAVGLRDVVVMLLGPRGPYYSLVGLPTIVGDEEIAWHDEPLVFVGVDAQYFAAVMLPQMENDREERYAAVMPLVVGPIPEEKNRRNRTNISCRVISQPVALKAADAQGSKLEHDFQIFAGPKRPDLLAHYGLGDLVYYGWFGWVSKPMLRVLHFFYSIIPNYGVAIILLTVLVRSCMFPISRKQALNAQKMQALQPEIKKLAEKYKNNLEARSKAQQDLFKKHNYHPLAGCLPVFLQLPIFMGLYRSLSVDIELRQAPLLGDGIRWASNLAAPDMLWHWEPLLPAFIAGETGWLGPYFNLLPCITIGLFIWQQKMFMPPPTDEQAAMQQKVMQYMMIFMGVMFFKVPSGLCLYFIASSLWGIAERKLLPKTIGAPAGGETAPEPRPAPVRAAASGNGAAGGKKSKHRGRK